MTASPFNERDRLLAEFRQALDDCRQLYLSGAHDAVRNHPDLLASTPDEFVALLLDLERGLVTKIFVEMAQCDWHWSDAERELAVEVFKHVWNVELRSDQVREALEHIVEQSGKLRWTTLVGPFERLPTLRERVAELQTVVTRLANLVAKTDGPVGAEEMQRLRWIEEELERHLVPIQLDEGDSPTPTAVRPTEAAMRRVATDAAKVRNRYRLDAPPPPPPPSPAVELMTVLAELDALIGIKAIKQDVRELVNFLKIQSAREQQGLPRTAVSLHMVFVGNPGTGKTTVARLVARILGAMGILARGHLVETDRSGLVAKYAGQTAPKTNERINEALDGVLFIDEAYSLVAERGDDAYGAEAVQILLKRMEDDRQRLVVVLAGYPEPMDRLLKSNPGLSSRFGRTFHFPDYTASELGQIFQAMCASQRYVLPSASRAKLLVGFQHLLDRADEHFGNGRLVRNVFERAIRRLANRIAVIPTLTTELLTTFEAGDILFDEIDEETRGTLAGISPRFVVLCPGCSQPARFSAELLGQRAQCKKCRHVFQADWGEIVEE